MATRGDWKLGANGCRGASWSDERFGANSLTASSRRGILLFGCLRASRTFCFLDVSGLQGYRTLSPLHGMLLSVLVCCCM